MNVSDTAGEMKKKQTNKVAKQGSYGQVTKQDSKVLKNERTLE